MSEVKNRALFENVPVARAVSKMAIPAIIGQLIILVYNIADTFFIGRTNDPFMVASASLILPVFNIPMLYIMNAAVGMYGLVWSQLLADILTVALSVIVHRRFAKQNFPRIVPA